ncbi:hypothetical protein CEXT_26431 [Caerostris extrusa]|uniref:Uncharacterized protein n=1 Tax=Caerostris extrusa TaxID=172846 RepID=A0AAV4VE45_CAEEX|nr:hypothetical protein CEXT_26431 [Caerostris extrusa]
MACVGGGSTCREGVAGGTVRLNAEARKVSSNHTLVFWPLPIRSGIFGGYGWGKNFHGLLENDAPGKNGRNSPPSSPEVRAIPFTTTVFGKQSFLKAVSCAMDSAGRNFVPRSLLHC